MIHPKTLLISRHFYSLESYVWRSIYNLIIDTISTYNIPLYRSFLKLWNDIRHVMPSTDRRLELKEKASMAQNAWQAFVYANGLKTAHHFSLSWARLTQPPSCQPILIIFFRVYLSPPSIFFNVVFPTKIICAFLFSLTPSTDRSQQIYRTNKWVR